MEASHALALMLGGYCSTPVGSAIPAIMLKVPGTASSLISIDGNALARKGRVAHATLDWFGELASGRADPGAETYPAGKAFSGRRISRGGHSSSGSVAYHRGR